MNDLDLCLEVVSRSCQPLCYIRRLISRKPLEIEAWFQSRDLRSFVIRFDFESYVRFEIRFVLVVRLIVHAAIVIRKETIGGG